MITGTLRNTIDKLWDEFWSGGITNPLTVIEQISYLLFIRKLDDTETRAEKQAQVTKKPMKRRIFPDDKEHQSLRWKNFSQLGAEEMIKVVGRPGRGDICVFDFIKELGSNGEKDLDQSEEGAKQLASFYSRQMKDAVFMIQKPSLLQKAVDIISKLDLNNPDIAGDLYEYLLSKLATSGINGQFRTPRHIIRMMVEIVNPDVGERICDPACGTAGFLISSADFVMEKYTSAKYITTEDDGTKHGFVGDKLSDKQRKFFQDEMFNGFDFDASMLRIASMNLWLHGLENPLVDYMDTLSKSYTENGLYDIILANPPFKGKLDYPDVNPDLLSQIKTKSTELLFVMLALRLLNLGGRCAIIVPDGVLFGSSNAHINLRKMLVEDNQLEGVISMPSGVFKPYAGVSTGILVFTRGGSTGKVWFYEMEHDGFSLDDKRNPVDDNDIPDVINCWNNRMDESFNKNRQARIQELKKQMQPLKEKRLKYNQKINELQYQSVIMNGEAEETETELEKQKQELDNLSSEIHILQNEVNQLGRQFWVSKKQIAENKYDLSSSRYREIEQDEVFYEKPSVILDRMEELESIMDKEIKELQKMI